MRVAVSVAVLGLLAAAEFLAPISGAVQERDLAGAPPTVPHLDWSRSGLVPVVYPLEREGDGWRLVRDQPRALRFLVGGEPYRLLGIFPTTLHLIGAQPPARLRLLGCDELGRDRFSRVLEAARSSVFLSVGALTGAVFLGLLVGAVAGWKGGLLDRVLTLIVDLLLALPGLFLLLSLRAALPLLPPPGTDSLLVVSVLVCAAWVPVARAAQAQARGLRRESFILAAAGSGAGSWWILKQHLFPALLPLARAQALPLLPALIVAEASLSYLGLGLREPHASLGTLIAQTSTAQAIGYPWLFSPILALTLILLMAGWLASDRQPPSRAAWGGETV
jgi:peptide/nickel transport system permease protein